MLLTTNRRFKHYKVNEDGIILKDGLLFRKYYGKTGCVTNYQILIPKQLVSEVLRSLLGEFGKHPGKAGQKLRPEKSIFGQIRLNLSGSWLFYVSNALENHGRNVNSPTLPCKTRVCTLLRQKTRCKLIWCRNYLRQLLWKHCDSHWRVFPLFIGIPDI